MSALARAGPASAANIYSPNNPSFYASKPYITAQRSVNEIRLIKVLTAGDYDELLWNELLSAQSLEGIKYRYHALSNCASDPKQTASMVVNGLHSIRLPALQLLYVSYVKPRTPPSGRSGSVGFATIRITPQKERIKFAP